MKTIIASERVSLVQPTQKHRDEFIAKARASIDLHAQWIKPPKDEVSYQHYLDRISLDQYEGCLVTTLDQQELVGVFNINDIVHGGFRSGYLGYYCFEGFQGRGLMSEALQLVIHHAFNDLNLHRLEANIQPDNKDSIALVKRNGFRHEGFSPKYLLIDGQWRDHERFAITVEDLL